MTGRVSILLFAVLCVLSPHKSYSQNSTKELSLQQAIVIALEHNPDLASAQLDVQTAEARVREAWGYALPVFDLQGRYTRALKKPVFFLPDFDNPGSGITRPIEIGSNHAVDLTLSARQTLFDATIFIGVGAAGIYSDVAREFYNAKKLETITNVRKAFYNVLMAREVLTMMEANLKNAEENLRNARLLTLQGLLSEYDELRAIVGVENLRPMVIESENNFQLSKDGLRSVMGDESFGEITIIDSLAYQLFPESVLENARINVRDANSTIRAMRLQVEVNRAFMNAERSNYLPTLSAFGDYRYQVSKNTLKIVPDDFVRSSQIGLSLSFNLFQGFQTNARVEQAKLAILKSEEQVSKIELNIETAVHSAVMRIRLTQKRIEAQSKTVEQAERGYRIAATRFASGSGTQLEVNDVQLALTQAKLNRIRAVYDYLNASAELDQLIGRIPDFLKDQETLSKRN